MAQIPDNIVSIMMVDNAGAVVSVPLDQFIAQASSKSTQLETKPSKAESNAQPSVTNVNTETTVLLSIDADENYIPKVNSNKDNLENSVLFQSGRKIGLNNTNPRFDFDVLEGSINIDSITGLNGYKLNGYNLAYANSSLNTIYLGDTTYKSIDINTLYLSGAIQSPVLTYNKLLQVQPDGKVVTYTVPSVNSVIFSDGDKLVGDATKLSWNASTSILNVTGYAKASTGVYTSAIGEYTAGNGVNALNTWTFASNVNIPATPTSPTHAASKEYVDNTALTGLKLGASVLTVSVSDISLSGLSAVNGYTPISGDRILVIGQTNATQNGVYIASSSGWSRATDSDSDAELRGYQYLVTAGTNANFRYGNTNQSTISVGSTNITYQAISAGETDPIFTASPSFGITNTNITNWTTAYNRSPVSLGFSGTSTKTLTLTKQDGSTLTASFGLTTSDITEGSNLYYTDARARGSISLTTSGTSGAATYNSSTGVLNIPQYQGGVTSITAGAGISVNASTGAVTITNTITNTNQLTNGAGFLTAESDTLQSVTSRGASTSVAITSTSTISAVGGFFESSDIRFKNVLGTNPEIDVSKIDTIKYMRTTYEKDKIRYGYSAQDVYEILPECVNNDGISLSINYTDIHTLKILQLEKRVLELEAKLGI
jgi:hypothetical protein